VDGKALKAVRKSKSFPYAFWLGSLHFFLRLYVTTMGCLLKIARTTNGCEGVGKKFPVLTLARIKQFLLRTAYNL